MWPFRRKKKPLAPPASPASPSKVEIMGDDFLSVDSLDFYGEYTSSPDGRYLIAWADVDNESGRGGFRESGKGTFLLIEAKAVIYKGHCERPNDGKVASNGTFIINDWMFGEGTKGTFYAFSKSGDQLIKHLFKANLYNNGLSDDGMFAVCQMANSDTDDGGTLALFNLKSKELVWQKIPETDWADSYEFSPDGKTLNLIHGHRRKFSYSI